MKNYLILCILLLNVIACKEKTTTTPNTISEPISDGLTGSLPSANGKAGSVLVSIDNSLWDGEIESIFNLAFKDTAKGPYIYLEYSMDFKQEDPSTINRIRKKHRNFLRIILDKENTFSETEVIVKKNFKAQNQLYIVIRDSDKNRLVKFLNNELKTYITLYDLEENDRLRRKYLALKNTKFKTAAEQKFGISIAVPKTAEFVANKDSIIYALDKNVEETTRDNPKTGAKGGIYWVQKGILIWATPYENKQSMDIAKILAIRDTTLKNNVKGMIEGSYMATEYTKSHKPTVEYITVDGNKAIKIEGLWKHSGKVAARGGGPFVQYSILHPKRKTIVHISTHIFAPRFSKREYIRQIRAILETITIVD